MMKIHNSNRNSKTNRNSHSNKGLIVKVIVIVVVKMSTRIIVIVIVIVTAYEDTAFWYCGARNAVSTLAAAWSAHEYCRLQHLCVDFVLMFVCFFLSFRCSFVVSECSLISNRKTTRNNSTLNSISNNKKTIQKRNSESL